LGYATFLNVQYVIANGGVDLAIGAVRIAVVALAEASFAGVTGYFLGRAKFENRGPFWLPVGLFLAAVLNGVVNTLLSEITRSGLRPTPLNGLILAALVAAVTFIILFGVLRRGSRPVTAPEGANS
jgi:RsiW-degrading membrane proteinase PrsW (M82 family)